MHWLLLAIFGTVGVSFLCSVCEATVLSTTVPDIEALKKSRPRRGLRLERIKNELDETIAAILTLNTIANGVGSVLIGVIGASLFGNRILLVVTAAFSVFLLLAGEVLPKNFGVVHRKQLQPLIVYPIWIMRRVLSPITYFCGLAVRLFIGRAPATHRSDDEIRLLAEYGARQGTLSKSESSLIANALSLDDIRVSEIMTPRTVVTALRRQATVGEVFKEFPNVPFGRMPVYGRNLDDIIGMIRRRDLLKAKANDQDAIVMESLMQEIHFIPETVTASGALQLFLKTHQQLLVAVDEFGSTTGVVTMEDVMEHLIGGEIFEKDDVAVDMRELARAKQQKQTKVRKPSENSPEITPFPTK